MKEKEKKKYRDIFIQYYENYHNDIFRYLYSKTGERGVALDLTQETFMKLWEYFMQEKKVEKERSFLYRIATNLVIDYYRKKKEILVEDFSQNQYSSFFEKNDLSREADKYDGKKIISLLHKLPPSTRDIIQLKFVHDFSLDEIAKTLGKDKKTISVYLHRGIKQLKAILKDYV